MCRVCSKQTIAECEKLLCCVWQDLATHTRVSPLARQASLVKLAQSLNRSPEARAELDKWGLTIDEELMTVCC